jgi:hypothetical protein
MGIFWLEKTAVILGQEIFHMDKLLTYQATVLKTHIKGFVFCTRNQSY